MADRERAPLTPPTPGAPPVWVDPHGRGPADARLARYGTPVWALVAYYEGAAGRDAARVAAAYAVPLPAVEAALARFEAHRAPRRARLVLNDAP